MHVKFCVIILLFKFRLAISYYHVKLTSDSPTVRGGTVHFVAELFEDGEPASGKFKYIWLDNSILIHTETHESESNVDTWSVTYPANASFPPGPYEVQVAVEKYYVLFYIHKTSQRLIFELTEHLNGKLQLTQNNEVLLGKYVSSAFPVVHKVELTKSDEEYINHTATSILTYWFVDCVYYGVSADYTFTLSYPEINKKHKLEALVVAGYEPITTVAPPTTTTTTTPTPNVTTAVPTSTTIAPITSTTASSNSTGIKVKRSAVLPSHNGILPVNNSFPFVCLSNGSVAPDTKKTYGLFSRKFISKAPVSNITVTGNYWLPKGDVLSLKVKCQGSSQFYYCKHIFEGVYNVTGNETCDVPPPDTSDECEFPIKRYFQKPQKYTIAIVIYNDVAKIVSPVTVTVYEVAHQAQLSVIVVPVASSLIAVVLIIFGVAYYVQNRSRFIVEVADFNFGQQCSDLEYKTFRERLYDSISNAFLRAPSPSSSEPNVWPPGRKYGSLT
ncbi:hypothetical protein RN001_009368 [Aquatica leii]|uniref:Uncharacterized protein n=1 Tax=Aquatica leii TaxID=1421715 RepID=A0AAN7PVB7_9COLE|nr:hypothetical protein RN001_009368 [Aquatica leii]